MPKGTPYYTSDPYVEIDYPSANGLQGEFTAWDNLSDEALTELESAIKRVQAPLHCRLIWKILDGVGIIRRFIRDGASCYKGYVASRKEIGHMRLKAVQLILLSSCLRKAGWRCRYGRMRIDITPGG